MLRLATTIGLAAALVSPSFAQFVLDVPPPDIRAKLGKLVVNDLAVGEVGLVNVLNWCAQDGQLFAASSELLEETPSDYGVSARVKRETGNHLAIEVIPGKSSSQLMSDIVLKKLAALSPCENMERFGYQYMPVSRINGFLSSSALIAAKGTTIP